MLPALRLTLPEPFTAGQLAGCNLMLSEAMSARETVGTVTVRNSFAAIRS